MQLMLDISNKVYLHDIEFNQNKQSKIHNKLNMGETYRFNKTKNDLEWLRMT